MSTEILIVELVVAACSDVRHNEDGDSFVEFTTKQSVVETYDGIHLEDRPCKFKHWNVVAPYVPGQIVKVHVFTTR